MPVKHRIFMHIKCPTITHCIQKQPVVSSIRYLTNSSKIFVLQFDKMEGVFLLVLTTLASAATIESNVAQGECGCAVFPKPKPDPSPEPIVEQLLRYNVTCDEEGAEVCQHLCIALAEGARDKAPALICEKLEKHVDNLKVGVFARSCNNGDQWMFTGLESPEPICCHGGKDTPCGLQVDSPDLELH